MAMTVQELAGALVTPDVPTQYVVQGHNDQQLASAATAPVPVIDLGRLFKQDVAGDEAAKLRSAIDSWGLILVRKCCQLLPGFSDQTCMHYVNRFASYVPAGQ